jgi:hypothetical protein
MAEGALRKRFALARDAGELPADADVDGLASYIITVIWGMSVQAAGGATREQLVAIASMAESAVLDASASSRNRRVENRSQPESEE